MAKKKLADGLPEGLYSCRSKGIDKDTFCIAQEEEFDLLDRLATTAKPSP